MVESILLCKLLKEGFGPTLVSVIKDGVKDTVRALLVSEAGHGIGTPTHFTELPFNRIGCAYLLPMPFGSAEEAQHSIQVFLQTGNRFRSGVLPVGFPLTETTLRFAAA